MVIKAYIRCLAVTLLLSPTLQAAETATQAASATAHASPDGKDTYYAIVDGRRISMREYQLALQSGMRQKFYHGKIPEAQLAAFRQEVSQSLIDRVLLLEEAKRLALKPDEKQIAEQISAYEKRYADSERWKKNKQSMLPGLRQALVDESLLKVLEARVRTIASPTAEQVNNYYRANPGLFTTPEQLELSLIMLRVAPSAGTAAWQAAQEEAMQIVARLKKGADFAGLARIHSGDKSASQGGKLESLHQGMLAEPVQKAVDALKSGQLADPVVTLQGVAIIRLDKRISAKLNPLASVRERAAKLWQRQASELAWSDLKEALRSSARVSINTAAL